MATKNEEIIKIIEEMKVSELNDLVKSLENHFDINNKIYFSNIDNKEKEEEETKTKTEVDIILNETGQSKVSVIKIISQLTNSSLMDAKKMIEKLPAIIKNKVKIEEAEEIKTKLINAGATIELK